MKRIDAWRRRDARSAIALLLAAMLAMAIGCDPSNGTNVPDDAGTADAGTDANTAVAVSGVTVTPGTLTLSLGAAGESLTATVTPGNASNPAVVWSSSDETVATVSATGLVTPIGVGTATITATTVDGGHTDTATITVSPIAVTGVALDADTLDLFVGGASATLVATVAPSNATNAAVSWSTSDADVATVSASGVVTPVGLGTATITVTTADGSFTATAAVSVAPIAVTGVVLNADTIDVPLSGSASLVAMVLPGNATNASVTWSSSDPDIVAVSDDGTLTPYAVGTATVTVTTVDGGFSDGATVRVVSPPTGITVSPASQTLFLGGPNGSASATVMPATASQVVTWTSDDEDVATVAANGTIVAVGLGSTTIRATTSEGGFTASADVDVVAAAVTGVTLDTGTLDKAVGDADSTLVATVTPSFAANAAVTWRTSDASVATVSASGVVHAVGSGSATITVETDDGGFTATCTVTVRPDSVTGTIVSAQLTGQLVVRWLPPVDPNATGVEVSMTSLDGGAILLPPQTVSSGTNVVVLSGLSYPTEYTLSLVTLGDGQDATATVVPGNTRKVTYILRSGYVEGPNVFLLDSTNGSGSQPTHDLVIARADEPIPTNYRFTFHPGLADPTDPETVSMMLERYDGTAWVPTDRWVRANASYTKPNAGQWYAWANPAPNTYLAFTDLDDASPTFAAEATFRNVPGSTPGSVRFVWYADTTRRLIHTYYHVMVQDQPTVGARIDADSEWFLEPVSCRTP